MTVLLHPADSPTGFSHAPGFLDPADEAALLAAISACAADRLGPVDLYGRPSLSQIPSGVGLGGQDPSLTLTATLDFYLLQLRERCADLLRLHPEELSQVIVTRSPPRAGFGARTDDPTFDGPIVGVVLGGAAGIVLRRRGTTVSLKLQARSLYVLEGESRWAWTHELRPGRTACASLTFRCVAGEYTCDFCGVEGTSENRALFFHDEDYDDISRICRSCCDREGISTWEEAFEEMRYLRELENDMYDPP